MTVYTKIGKYEVRRQIGRGAMGAVFEAFDPTIERRVAIKTLRLDVFEESQLADVRTRFKREAQLAGQMSHPHIVTVHDYGEHEGTPYIVMEYMTGSELSKIIEKGVRLPLSEVVRLMTQLLGALAYAHERKVVHRDIKPGNIFVLEDSSLKVVDFGIARVEASNLTDTGAMLGTPAYMSPEQFLALPVDERSDIFATGVIFYELLTGDKPFTGSVTTIMQKVLRQEPVEPSVLNPLISHAWDAVAKRAMAKKPEARFQSARQFAETIKQVFDSRAVQVSVEATLLPGQRATAAPEETLRTEPARAVAKKAQAGVAQREELAKSAPSRKKWALGLGLVAAIVLGLWVAVPSSLWRSLLHEAAKEKSEEAHVVPQMKIAEKQAKAPAVEQKAAETKTAPEKAPSAAVGPSLTAGTSFRDCDECPEMVAIPAGSFIMGSPDSELDHQRWESPQHQVTIPRTFAAGKYEVTFDEWDACVSESGCNHRPGDQGWGRGRRPVINVSWNDAKEYVAWLSRKTGKTYQLLSESEWEYVTRAGTTTAFAFGKMLMPGQANYSSGISYAGSPTAKFRGKTVPVGSYAPNAFGVYDTHGNVAEWLEDCRNHSYDGAPSDGSAWLGGNCADRAIRGGAWGNGPKFQRSASRGFLPQAVRQYNFGLRVAANLAAASAQGPAPAISAPPQQVAAEKKAEAEKALLEKKQRRVATAGNVASGPTAAEKAQESLRQKQAAQSAAAASTAAGNMQPCPSQYAPDRWSNCLGTFTSKSGHVYVGEWRDGKLNGQGTDTYPSGVNSGVKYVGEFRDGKYSGRGKIGGGANGNWYDGEFREGMYNGQGTYTWPDRKYVGEFKDGKRNAHGTETFNNGEQYVGEYKDDKRHGQGTYTWPNGGKFVGQYRDGQPNGQGTLTGPDGQKYDGEWKDGKYNGQGTYSWPNGRKYIGEWRDGKLNGQAKEYEPDGTLRRSGTWKDGVFQQ